MRHALVMYSNWDSYALYGFRIPQSLPLDVLMAWLNNDHELVAVSDDPIVWPKDEQRRDMFKKKHASTAMHMIKAGIDNEDGGPPPPRLAEPDKGGG